MFSLIKNLFRKLPKWLCKLLCVLFLVLLIVFSAILISQMVRTVKQIGETESRIEEARANNTLLETIPSCEEDEFIIQFIDVGQADCTFISNGSSSMLIDAGNNEDGELIVKHLKRMGVTKIDYLIGTHPHEDHIGGLDDIIKNFTIGCLVMPNVSANTQTFEDVLTAASKKGVSIHTPKAGETWKIGEAICTVVSCEPVKDISDLNEWSIVLHLDTKFKDFLFMSDSSHNNENAILDSGLNIKADFLRCAHHGSEDSNSKEFVRAVDPTYVIVSVGEDNEYGHPHAAAMKTFQGIADYTMTTKDFGTIEVVLAVGKPLINLVATNCDGQ